MPCTSGADLLQAAGQDSELDLIGHKIYRTVQAADETHANVNVWCCKQRERTYYSWLTASALEQGHAHHERQECTSVARETLKSSLQGYQYKRGRACGRRSIERNGFSKAQAVPVYPSPREHQRCVAHGHTQSRDETYQYPTLSNAHENFLALGSFTCIPTASRSPLLPPFALAFRLLLLIFARESKPVASPSWRFDEHIDGQQSRSLL